jgi:FO synthase
MAIRVLDATGLLPHLNPEVLTRSGPSRTSRNSPRGPRRRLHPQGAPHLLPGGPWLGPRLLLQIRALADPATGLARTDVVVAGRPWQEPEDAFASGSGQGRTDLHRTIDTEGRTGDGRENLDEVYGGWEATREQAAPGMVPTRWTPTSSRPSPWPQ